ncbi:phosphonate ABC transporter, permease protein PhnE [Paraburkholderia sp. Ac-20336]|uniref:phosphonate ABC transporter, permease protein PhnE n=1 Tax=unclassified Paraburkholderia TaxID=2615204 RepID=UPI00197E63CA|nr:MULTISPECIES: phosphonate ABC transporter, permease protein PhnE [unclassified Paraburkholderia]MBN3806706.1 phosphonate ABC transporter, permease protein PhnE [Paraburkholderia sp. Ac-20336]MBN3851283.1 phosphonate ABC transporter, permease protein PhnE [Paraburkholderia sp. Ac-20342]
MNPANLVTSPAPADDPSAARAAAREARAKAAGKLSWRSLLGWIVVLAVLGGTWHSADMRPFDLISDAGNMGQFAKDFFPPDFTEWRTYVHEMFVTLSVAIWGTALSLVCAVPFGLMSAHNIAPMWVVQPVRRLMDACRAINEMVFAMLFIVAVGLGPFAGVLALWVHTTGVLAKLFAEAVEAIDPRPAEGVRATGATPLDEIVYAVLPQVLPLWISYALYRFESNVRSAMVVGMVGAGGIGVVLYEAIRSFDYAQTSALMIMVIVVVTVIDLSSAWLRDRVI